MVSRTLAPGIAFVALVTTAVVTALPASADAAGRDCRVVRLAEPRGMYDGSVIDVERVGRQDVYVGFSHESVRGVEHQRALVWRGLGAAPTRLGPAGYEHDVVFELTANGLVNGQSENPATGEVVPWIQDLATMRLRYYDVDSGPRGSEHGGSFIRRINSRSEAAGVVDRTTDPWNRGRDAVAFAGPGSPMTLLPGSAESVEAGSFGINEAGDRTGFVGTRYLPGVEDWLVYEPVVWRANGAIIRLATTNGIEAAPRSIKDDGSVSGSMIWGQDAEKYHFEAAYWPSPGVLIGLGVLPGGGWSDAYGMDEGGWVVGNMDRLVDPKREPLGPDGFVDHAFLRTPSTAPGKVRILPSLYGVAQGMTDWRKWGGYGTHAVNGELDQVGSATHVGWRRGRPAQAPTVFLNASRCGVEVATTHDPSGLATGSGAEAEQSARDHRSTRLGKHELGNR